MRNRRIFESMIVGSLCFGIGGCKTPNQGTRDDHKEGLQRFPIILLPLVLESLSIHSRFLVTESTRMSIMGRDMLLMGQV